MRCIPLHLNAAADPTRRCAIVSGLDFDAAIQMHRAFAILVIAERFERQRKQSGLLLGEHRCNLALGGAVNTCVGPTLLPMVQIRLRFLQALEAEPFERRPLRMADARFDLALAVGSRTRQGKATAP